jgi:hypothetical protein
MFEAKLHVVVDCPALEALAAALVRTAAPTLKVTGAQTPTQAAPAQIQMTATTSNMVVSSPAPVVVQSTVNPTPAGAPIAPAQTNTAPYLTPAPTAPAPMPQPPVNQMPMPTGGAPLAQAPTYTLEQVGKAGADLIASNPAKLGELMPLLGQFGVQAITELKPEQLGAFVTALRGLGARI